MKNRMMKMFSRFFTLALALSLVTGAFGCGLTMDEERAMLDAEQDYEQYQAELIRKPSFGGIGFDMNKCIEDCKEENENDGTIENLQVYCETRCKIREIFEGAGANSMAP